jgi:Na+/proline symporter
MYCAGLYYRFSGDRQRTTKEYLMADGQMSVLPVAFSLMASFMSAITLLGVTQVSSHPSIKHHPAEVSLVLNN